MKRNNYLTVQCTGLYFFASEFNRPRSLLVFVNPIGGKRQGLPIYRDKVAPIFDLAGIVTEVVTTVRQNHARDMLNDYDLTKIDG